MLARLCSHLEAQLETNPCPSSLIVGRCQFLAAKRLRALISCCMSAPGGHPQLLLATLSSLPGGPLHRPSHNVAMCFCKDSNREKSKFANKTESVIKITEVTSHHFTMFFWLGTRCRSYPQSMRWEGTRGCQEVGILWAVLKSVCHN